MTEHQMTTSEPKQESRIITAKLTGDRSKDIYDLINYYRLLKRESWNTFLLTAIAEYIKLENDMISEAIISYLTRPKPRKRAGGRPLGVPMRPEQKRYISERMKQVWADRKRVENLNNEQKIS